VPLAYFDSVVNNFSVVGWPDAVKINVQPFKRIKQKKSTEKSKEVVGIVKRCFEVTTMAMFDGNLSRRRQD
jgi:hypothetical protein